MLELRKFVPFVKMVENEDGRHVAYGLSTAELVDKDKEICDYADTAPQYKAWSDEIHKATAGSGQEASLGNIRIQHTLEMGGKVVKLEFNPEKQQVWIGAEPKNEEIWEQLRRGFYTGFSQGGRYLYRKCDECKTEVPDGHYCVKCRKDVIVRYAAKISEVSFVDNPCLAEAHFSFVKGMMADKTFAYVGANGMELRKFVLEKKDPGQQIDQEALPKPEPGMDAPKCSACKVEMAYKCPTCGCGIPEATHPQGEPVKADEDNLDKGTPRHPSGKFTNRASGAVHEKLKEAGYDHVRTGTETPVGAAVGTEVKYYKHGDGSTVALHEDGRWTADTGKGKSTSGRGVDLLNAHLVGRTAKTEDSNPSPGDGASLYRSLTTAVSKLEGEEQPQSLANSVQKILAPIFGE